MPLQYAIALTGGIATGKSTVAKIFEEEGFTIIDADKIAHQMLHETAREISELFGGEVLQNGTVDRKRLGAIVFEEPQKRKALESLLHPKIYDEIHRLSQIEDVKEKPYLLDIPLFFETGRYNVNKVIVVYASPSQQLERAMQRDALSADEVARRLAAQMDIEEKRAKAHYLIDNSGDSLQLQEESRRIINEIKKDFS